MAGTENTGPSAAFKGLFDDSRAQRPGVPGTEAAVADEQPSRFELGVERLSD